MKKVIFTLIISTAALNAQVLETGNYGTGTLGNQATTGTGLTGNWGGFIFGNNAGGTSTLEITSGSISAPTGYGYTATNNKIEARTSDLDGVGFVKLDSGIDFSADATFYMSYLTTSYDNGWTSNIINFIEHIPNSTNNTIFTVGELNTGASLGGQLGINSQTSTELIDTNGTNAVGQDALVVVRIDTTSAGNDTISASFWRSGIDTVGSEPVSWAVTDTIASSATVNFLGLRTQDGFGNLTPAFDEIRFGATYDSVVVPEPSAYSLIAGALALSWIMVRRKK